MRSIFPKPFLQAKSVYTKSFRTQIAGGVHNEEKAYYVTCNLRNEQYARALCDSLDGVHIILRERVKGKWLRAKGFRACRDQF